MKCLWEAIICCSLVFSWSLGASGHVEDDQFRAQSRGKDEVFAREEWEFRLPSTEVRGFALNDFQYLKHVILIAMPWGDCPDAALKDWIIRANKLGRAEFQVIPVDPHADINRENALQSYRDELRREWKQTRYLFDPIQMVSGSLLFKNSGDFAVFDPKGPRLLHSGTVDELKSQSSFIFQKYIPQVHALSAAVQDACAIRYRTYEKMNFEEGFLRPFSRACQACHVRSEVYDLFPTLESTIGWKAMSLRTIRLGRMPGGHDPHYRHPHRASVSVEDLRRVVHWLSQDQRPTEDMSAAFAADHAARLNKALQERRTLEAPVLDISVGDPKNPQMIPAEGPVRYLHIKLGEPLKEDLVLRGIQAEMNLNVIHHANIMALPLGKLPKIYWFHRPTAWLDSLVDYMQNYIGAEVISGLKGWLGGSPADFSQVIEPILMTFSRRAGLMEYPRGRAFFLPKGTQLGVQLHIQSSGVEEPLRARFQFFSQESEKSYQKLKRFSVLPTKGLRVPANRQSFLSVSELPFSKAAHVHTLWIHTHYRGVAARVRLFRKNGEEVTVASFPFLQMKMNSTRSFEPALYLRAGDKIVTEIEYDNSKYNLANPNPARSISLGGSTLDHEMHYARFVVSDAEGEEK